MTRPKVAIIGNSHAAALKKALDQNPSICEEFEIEFFVAGGKLHYDFFLDEDLTFRHPIGLAVSPGSGIYRSGTNDCYHIDLSNAENVLYIGRTLGELEAAHLSLNFDVDQIIINGRSQRLSKLAFDRYCVDMARRFLPPGRWLQALPFHLTLSMAPYPASSLASNNEFHPGARAWKPIADDPCNLRPVSKAYQAIFAATAAHYGIAFLSQPESTLNADGLTLPEFVRDRTEIHPGEGITLDDFRHMNAEFGLQTLNAYLDSVRLRVRPKGRSKKTLGGQMDRDQITASRNRN